MTKPIAVHYDTGRHSPTLPNAVFLPCTGSWWHAADQLTTTDLSKVSCRNCQRTKPFLSAIKAKFAHLTAKPIRAPWPKQGRCCVVLDGMNGIGMARLMVMGESVENKRSFM